jgi:hypothetical protein
VPEELLDKSGFLIVGIATRFKARTLAALEAADFGQPDHNALSVVGAWPRITQAMVADV